MNHFLRWCAGLIALLILVGASPAADNRNTPGHTPPRLSLIDGTVSFWRTGADDWSAAVLNTPLSPGDALYTDEDANLELQIGPRAFVRAGERTEISVVNLEADYLQFRIADGQASFDLRALPAGLTIEVNTPNAAFLIERSGYYRLNVDQDTTSLITRRGGRATITPSGGNALAVSPSEELIVEGTDTPRVETYAVPELDRWDRWNYERTDHLVDALSSRYVPPDVYGADALDDHGDWRVEPTYGALWVPSGLPPNWAPYSDGHWIWDAFYGWTWIDNAPWGWAPFHYGRWVFLNGYWAWAPGPMASRSVYAPALVAFFDSRGGSSVSVSVGLPGLSWVALSWGEPLLPWWGHRGFIGVPWWGGWYGPRTQHVTQITNVTNVTNITNIYQNTRVSHAVIAAPRDKFGRGRPQTYAVEPAALTQLVPVRGHHPVRPDARSVLAGAPTAVRPTHEVLARPAVAVRAPKEIRLPWKAEKPKGAEASPTLSAPNLRFVPRPQGKELRAAPFGGQAGPERTVPEQAPRFEGRRRFGPPATTEAPRGDERRGEARDERRNDGRADDRRGDDRRGDDRRADERRGELRRAVPTAPANVAPAVVAPAAPPVLTTPPVQATPPASPDERRAGGRGPRGEARNSVGPNRDGTPTAPTAPIGGAPPPRRGEETAPGRNEVSREPAREAPRQPRRSGPASPQVLPALPAGREIPGREAGGENRFGRAAEAARREPPREQVPGLPGNPANRLSPKRRHADEPEGERGGERGGGHRH